VANNYVVTDLGTLPGGSSSTASDVNDQGQAVGSSEPPEGWITLSFGLPQRLSVTLGHFPAVPTAAHPGSTSAAWSQASPIWQAAAAELMLLFGVALVECKTSVRFPAITQALRWQSMPALR
jgi:hypothetical protein